MRQRKIREETRRLILDAAYALFEEKGYKAATMRELASRAGVALGTIFQHFPDKSALLAEAFAGDIAEVVEEALCTMPDRDVQAQGNHVARAMFGYYARRPRLSRELVGQVFATEGEAADRLRVQMEEGLERAAALFEAAKARGEIRPETDCREAALAFWSYYLTCLNMGLWAPQPDLAFQAGQMQRLMAQLMAGIGA